MQAPRSLLAREALPDGAPYGCRTCLTPNARKDAAGKCRARQIKKDLRLSAQVLFLFDGAAGRNRTHDPLVRSQRCIRKLLIFLGSWLVNGAQTPVFLGVFEGRVPQKSPTNLAGKIQNVSSEPRYPPGFDCNGLTAVAGDTLTM